LQEFYDCEKVLLRFNGMASHKSKRINFKRPARTSALITVGRVEDVPPGCGATVELETGGELALFNVGGKFYATENFCPHKGAPLADGNLCGGIVECDWHGWRFDLATGHCLTRRGADIETYEVIIEDGWIKIRV
jgi:nitrite reductase/ring-hydroxylating ferredoxin subunit